MTAAKKPPRNAEPVESCNETWYLSEVTPALRKAFSRTVRVRARQQLIDDKEALGEEEYAVEWERLQARIDQGAYEWGPPVELGGTGAGKAIRAAFDTTDGNLQLLQLLLAETHGEVSLTQVSEMLTGNPEGVSAAVRAAMGLPPLPVAPAEPEPGQTETSAMPPTPETATASVS